MITYHIEKALSLKERVLVLRLTSDGYSAVHLRKKVSGFHLEALEFFLAQELVYQTKVSGRKTLEANHIFQFCHILYPKTPEALHKLASIGQLYLAEKQLVIDLYAKTEFYYQVEVDGDKHLNITGRIQLKSTDFDLSACDFICAGPPHWFIKGISLKFIATDISWKGLQTCYEGVSNELEQGIRVQHRGLSQAVMEQQAEPIPLLQLVDRSGAFANLWMDYGKGGKFLLQEPSKGVRLAAAEKMWEKDLLETSFIPKNVGTSHYYCPMDQVAKSLAFLLEVGWHIVDHQERRVVQMGKTHYQMRTDETSLTLKGILQFDNFEADLSQVVGAFNRRERFVELGTNAVGLLPQRMENLDEVCLEGEWVGKELVVPKTHMGALQPFFENEKSIQMDLATQNLKGQLNNFTGIVEALPSVQFTGILRPYQQLGVNWLSFLYDYGLHGLLADDMGLGKTVQVLAFLSRLELKTPILIVLPTSLMFNWKREIERFLPTFSVEIHQGPLRTRSSAPFLTKNGILTTYTTLRNDLQLFTEIQWHCVILDEAQAIKNGSTQTAQAVYQLKARFRLSITGTPLENRLEEIGSHFQFLIPSLFGDAQTFQAELLASEADVRYLKRIQKKMRPFILRRKKEEVAQDLPEKIEQCVWVEMGEAQRSLYDQFLAGVRGNLLKKVQVDGAKAHRMEILEALLRLRQICCHPLLVSSPDADSAKFEALLQDVETVVAEGRKALVYSQFTTLLSILGKRLTALGIPYAYLDGSTKNREECVRRFQEDPQLPLFLISLKAGGVGLNLTAADYVFLYDPWWNEAAENQAIDRAHRIGRKDIVIAKRYITVESVEEKMMTLKAHKRSLVDHLLEDGSAPEALSMDDLSFLFS